MFFSDRSQLSPHLYRDQYFLSLNIWPYTVLSGAASCFNLSLSTTYFTQWSVPIATTNVRKFFYVTQFLRIGICMFSETRKLNENEMTKSRKRTQKKFHKKSFQPKQFLILIRLCWKRASQMLMKNWLTHANNGHGDACQGAGDSEKKLPTVWHFVGFTAEHRKVRNVHKKKTWNAKELRFCYMSPNVNLPTPLKQKNWPKSYQSTASQNLLQLKSPLNTANFKAQPTQNLRLARRQKSVVFQLAQKLRNFYAERQICATWKLKLKSRSTGALKI